ncbi:P-loop NTPase family protein [Roseovarius aestuarii]|uniref:Chromosomal replication initiator protein DnaA n=1 Tax=Roseovarius aestuarii TaxID=475083 RepID=A0A1X7BSJ2_9RHOB|nr:DnaA/Hda family protein [Roseovarius aestuarii]SMC12577.1 Chromosomal replication initiator protein DnaA [Roseovarius aestuarii]
MAQQLSFDLPVRQALGREDFFVSPANAAAVGMIEGWQGWAARKLVLTGPAGSGKTHLVHVWAALSDAKIVAAQALSEADIPALASGNIAVEDAQTLAGDRDAEEALFHLHNLALAEGHALLITASKPAQHWGVHLPDLTSRMQGTAMVALEAPDDTLLTAVLMKLFADRQIFPAPETIPYLIPRMPRSFAAARAVVTALDEAALEHGRPINRTLARQVLDKLAV